MRISDEALDLLSKGEFDALQSLPFEKLFHPEVQNEIYTLFLNNRFIETTQPALEDAITLRNIERPCVVSSGHIFSQEVIEELIRQSNPSAGVLCPKSRVSLDVNIAGTGQAYVNLPKLDNLLRCFDALRSIDRETSIRERASAHGEQIPEVQPIAEEVVDFKFSLLASNGRIIIKIEFTQAAKPLVQLMRDYLQFILPQGEVGANWPSHILPQKAFSRCWWIHRSSLTIKFGYPTSAELEGRRTFNLMHLNEVVRIFLKAFDLPVADDATPVAAQFSIHDLTSKDYVTLLDNIPVAFNKFLYGAHQFILYTAKKARDLRIDVNDVARRGGSNTAPARYLGHGFFEATHNILTSTSTRVTHTSSAPR